MVTFNLYEVPFSFFFMFGFSEVWGGYEMPDFQRKTMKRKREYQLHYEIGQKWAREIKAGSRPLPTWIEVTA